MNVLIFLANLTSFLRNCILFQSRMKCGTIGVDLIGPLPEGNKYIMTVSCLFSKWPEATALPDKTATGVSGSVSFFFASQDMAACCKVTISESLQIK